MSSQQQQEAIKSIANVSTLLRNAIAAAIPVSPDQYMTVSIPGTVIDTTDIADGGTYVYDASKAVTPPLAVQQAEAALVDGIMPLANIMIGNTGKSVSRSYMRALDSLVPRKATISTGASIRSPGEKSYDDAMAYLTARDPETGLTKVQIYTEKQIKWADAQEKWDKARYDAREDVERRFPKDLQKQIEEYQQWNQANFRKYKSSVQGEWMDWVTNGDKYNVEYNFGVVDIDSVMARVEQSKESMRNSSIVDSDGANELWGVQLTPKNWATLCKGKVEGWWQKNGTYSLEELEQEIARLKTLKLSYTAMKTAAGATTDPKFPGNVDKTGDALNTAQQETDVRTAVADLLNSQGEYNSVLLSKQPTQALKDTKLQDVKAKRLALEAAQNALSEKQQRANRAAMNDTANSVATTDFLQGKIDAVTDQIGKLTNERAARLAQDSRAIAVPTQAHSKKPDGSGSDGVDLAPPGAELAALKFDIDPPPTAGNEEVPPSLPAPGGDPWTTITLSYSAQDVSKTESESSWGFSVGGGVGWGLWSVGGSYSHEQSNKDMAAQMASCDVNIKFSALVVNIRRPWLYGELFTDNDLDTSGDIKLSPGAESVQRWIKEQRISDLAQYNAFPAYTTAFILAADTEIEFAGATQSIESHFSARSDAGSLSVGYGPFSVSSSFHSSESKSSYQMKSTATGCKLSFGAPQIIGWVSQILPALPRVTGFEAMVQTVVRQV